MMANTTYRDSINVITWLAIFDEASCWFMQRWEKAKAAANIATYGTNDPLAIITKAMAFALSGTSKPEPNPARYLEDSSEYKEQVMNLLQSCQRLARIADAWGFNNRPLLSFAQNAAPLFNEQSPDLKILLEQLYLRAENIQPEIGKDSTTTEIVAMTPNEEAVFDELSEAPQLGADIVAALARKGITTIDAPQLSKICKRKHMAQRGIRMRRGAGYYITKTPKTVTN